jgi:hypothetical protein
MATSHVAAISRIQSREERNDVHASRVSCIAASVAWLLGWAALLTSQGEPRHVISTGHPIEQQLRAEDRSVVLVSNLPPPLLVRLSSDAIHAMTDNTAISFFGTAINKESRLTENRTWITSMITMRLDRTFKSDTSITARVGDTLQFEESGGRVQFERVTVEAVLPWSRPIKVGEQYLVFGSVEPSGSILTGPESIYELTRPHVGLPRFKRLMTTDEQPQEQANGIEELLPDEVFDRIERRLEASQR